MEEGGKAVFKTEEEQTQVTSLDPKLKEVLHKVANSIRQLSMDAVQAANSGHPGMPLGCAELGAYLYGYALQHNPSDPDWINRDRMILSAGHGSMWLYSCLHLAGYPVSLDMIKSFRQLHSHTPGHPESTETIGVETTTGPLGQGFGNAVGMALGLKMLAARFNQAEQPLIDNKVFCLVGDGCIMEGVTSEVSSLAGHLKLNNLVVLYDANKVSLDGPLSESCSEDTMARYQAYGWDVAEVDGHDFDDIHRVLGRSRQSQKRPLLVVVRTLIGKGAPNKAGTSKVHGSPLGEEEVKLAKEALGLPDEKFFVPQAVRKFFESKLERDQSKEAQWQELRQKWEKDLPDLAERLAWMEEGELPENLQQIIEDVELPESIAGRKASNAVINALAPHLPQLIGGSADLSCSDMTMMTDEDLVAPGSFAGRNIKFGVREFGMATMATGLAQLGTWRPYVGTFLVFSDYMRNAIRLAALQKARVIYQFTHDSILLGEDGPTHQPIEQLASLRAMPQLKVMRPADANEVKRAWFCALHSEEPVAFALSRQSLPTLEETQVPFEEGFARGAYFLKKTENAADFTLIATGSEVALALNVARELEKVGKAVRVISMPCWELFEQQSSAYKAELFGENSGRRVSIEAGVEQGWHKYIGTDGIAIAMESFGASAPGSALAREFGFTVDSILERLL